MYVLCGIVQTRAQITQLLVGRLSADLQQRCYRNIGLAMQMMWQFEAAGRPPDDGPAWNALKNVRNPLAVVIISLGLMSSVLNAPEALSKMLW